MARYVSGLILTAVVIALIVFAPPAVCEFVVLALSLIAAREFFTLIRTTLLNRVIGVAFTVFGVATLLFRFEAQQICAFLYVVMALSFILQITDAAAENKERIRRAAFLVLGTLYITVSFGFLGRLFMLPHYQFWVFLTLVCTFLGDTGAYFAGKGFGRSKLAPSISPAKTNEGLVGGLVGGAVGAVIVRLIFWQDVGFFQTLFLGTLIALVGVLGDLSESMLKRTFDVKDSGTLIPGHGGILDRVDGLMFTAPFVYFAAQWM